MRDLDRPGDLLLGDGYHGNVDEFGSPGKDEQTRDCTDCQQSSRVRTLSSSLYNLFCHNVNPDVAENDHQNRESDGDSSVP